MSSEHHVEVRLLERLDEVTEEAWDGLLAADSSPFMEWAWLQALEEARCVVPQRGWLPRHLTVWRDGKLVAAAPAYLKGNSEGEFVFDYAWAGLADKLGVRYYPKLVLAVPFTPVTGDRVLVAPGEDRVMLQRTVALAAQRIMEQLDVSSAHLLFPREAEVPAFESRGWLPRLGVQFHWHNRGYGAFDDFLSALGSKKKHQIKRERRLVREDGITVETLRGDRIDDAAIAFAFQIYLSTVDKYVWGRRYLNDRFFRLVRERWAKKGRLELVVATYEGRRVAGAINVARGKRLYGRYWGCLEEHRFLHFEVCYYHAIEECIARGFEAFEPGAGGEHKARRGFDPTATHSAHLLRDTRFAALIRDHLVRERAYVQRVVAGEIEDDAI